MLRYNGISITDRTVALLGAGGAARSVLSVILEENPKSVYIVCRNVVKGNNLLNDLKTKCARFVSVNEMSILKKAFECDIIINATSAGLTNAFDIDLGCVHVNYCAIDLQYHLNSFTQFLQKFKNKRLYC